MARNETKALQTSIQLHDADIATKIYLADVSRPREVFIYTHRTPPRRPPHTPRVPLVSLARSEASCGLRTRSEEDVFRRGDATEDFLMTHHQVEILTATRVECV